ncbi:MBL fold metallo-hydrolase [Sphingomonas abietis]|uniref:MBL fold metallo-hydrolase n=1 Tax=Sphingomonas abietis TaxID=3012344 RepID=A0ABY7NKZ3_9SPHN|nr:MBL fold metallo-hydrolase [Sphingomonas abietis]WBO21635.1 MBL fold metallo-hydrolase [Sphingomonas abietis]
MTDQPLFETVHPLVRRVLAQNPSPFTYTGTQTHIVGHGAVAVIDPGPAIAAHVEAILAATAGETIVAIVCTHTHRDHTPAAQPLAAATGAPVMGCAPIPARDGSGLEAGFDHSYAPDRVMGEGDTVSGPGWTLEAIATPGHTSNHLCFALPEAQALFTGDHVMGWSTSVVVPPDGDMGAYMASLDKLSPRDDLIYFPAHGEPVTKPKQLLRGMLGHRRQREAQIVRILGEGPRSVPEMVAQMYAGLDPRLEKAAGASVLAHLLDLDARGRVRATADIWSLAA